LRRRFEIGCARRPRRTPLCVAHHVSVIGTLGVVLRSKTNHQIENARPLVEELIAAGMFLDDEFVDRVLASIGE
jgi:predicted nucleic acid-binding protein